MILNSFHLILILATALFVFGVWYALHIYHYPPKEGFTYMSVFWGVFITCLGMTFAIAGVLADYELLEELWYMALFPFGSFAFSGGPMLLLQEIKRREMESHSKFVLSDIERRYGKKWLESLKLGPPK